MQIPNAAIILAVAAITAGALLFARSARGEPSEDAQVIGQLKDAGSDVSKPHAVDFYLYVPTQEAADRAAVKVRGMGYVVKRLDRAATGPGWLVLAHKTIVPTESNLIRSRKELDAVARAEGGEYDGWEAAVSNEADV